MLTHRRAKIVAVGTLGAGFRVANVTFRHIVCERTRKCIYVKPAADPFNTGGTTVEAAYENISVVGPTLQFPVMIGPFTSSSTRRARRCGRFPSSAPLALSSRMRPSM